ncbi:MAG: AEC family transporter [Alphaproteobacteria bacterium]
MADIFGVLLPVFALIFLGLAMRESGFPGNDMWGPVNKLCYFILYPAMITSNLLRADLNQPDLIMGLGLSLVGSQLVMALILLPLPKLFGVPGPKYSSVVQGAVRWNGFIALGIIAAMLGDSGLTLAAIALGFMVPVANILSVTIVAASSGQAPSLPQLGMLLLKNPLLIACAVGTGLNLSGIGLWQPAIGLLDILSDASISIGLIAIGAGLYFEGIKGDIGLIVLTTVLKLFGMPLLAAIGMTYMGVTGETFVVGIVCTAVPGATSSYILAQQLGGDARLMAALITVGTLISIITMPAILDYTLRYVGM